MKEVSKRDLELLKKARERWSKWYKKFRVENKRAIKELESILNRGK